VRVTEWPKLHSSHRDHAYYVAVEQHRYAESTSRAEGCGD
jgi:hypothetical protein